MYVYATQVSDHHGHPVPIFLEDCAAKVGEGCEPERDAGAVVLGAVLLGVVERLDDGVAQHVEGERREVLERVHHGVDEVVVQLGGNSVML